MTGDKYGKYLKEKFRLGKTLEQLTTTMTTLEWKMWESWRQTAEQIISNFLAKNMENISVYVLFF